MDVSERSQQLMAAIAAQESLRQTLGDLVVDVTISALREQLAKLQVREPGRPSFRGDRQVEGERKHVTVLFADLCDFTSLSERIDPEIMRGLQEDLFHELASIVRRYQGFVEKFVGDAIFAVFGAPVTREDDAERSLHAALSMRQRMERINRHWAGPLGVPVALHISVNSGTVVAGEMGVELGGSYAVTGDTINTASRLLSAAGPNEILVNLSTYRMTREAFFFRTLHPLTAKGKREPLRIFALERARLHPDKSRGLEGLRPPIVGRDRELAELDAVGEKLADGEGQIVTIVGEAGIGKSRLVAEWRARLQARQPLRWLEGRCFSHTSTIAYGPFLDVFRRFAGISDEDSEAQARARMRQAVEQLFPKDQDAHAIIAHMLAMRLSPAEAKLLRTLSGEALRNRIFSVVRQVIERVTLQGAVLLIEDLHWADATSLELLQHLLPLTRRLPLVVILVFRSAPEKLVGLLPPVDADGDATGLSELHLAPLSDASSLLMLTGLLGSSQAPPALRELLLRKVEGNPFFVEEMTRSLIDLGALVRTEDGTTWTTTPLIDTVTVPDTVKGVLMSRLDRLPRDTKQVAQQASVIGRFFGESVLRSLVGDPGRLEADLSRLVQEDLVREAGGGPESRYAFKHALTQEVAYESLLGPPRRELHRRIGEAMERLFAERLAELHSVVADHFLLGEAWDKAVTYLIHAGDAAQSLFAHPEARHHYARALAAVANLPDTETNRCRRVDTIVKLVSVSFGAQSPERSLALLREAEALAWQLPGDAGGDGRGDSLRLARIHNWTGRSHMYRNDMRKALEYYRQVLVEARDVGEQELLRAIPASVMGRVLMAQGHFGEAGRLVAEAIGPLDQLANSQEWTITVGYHGISLAARGHYAAGLREAERALARARDLNNLTAISVASTLVTVTRFFGGDAADLLGSAQSTVEAAVRSGDPMYQYAGYGFTAWADSRLGHHAAAAEAMHRSKAVGESLGGRLILADWFAAAEAELALNAGRMAEAVASARQALDTAKSVGGLLAEGLALRVWGSALARLDPSRMAEAAAHVTAAIEALERGDARLEGARARLALGVVHRRAGDTAAARAQFTLAEKQFKRSRLLPELGQARCELRSLRLD